MACDPSRFSQQEQIAIRRSSAGRKKRKANTPNHSPAADVAHIEWGVDHWLFSLLVLDKRRCERGDESSLANQDALLLDVARRTRTREREKKEKRRARKGVVPIFFFFDSVRNERENEKENSVLEKEEKMQNLPPNPPPGRRPPGAEQSSSILFCFHACAFFGNSDWEGAEEHDQKNKKTKQKQKTPPLSSSPPSLTLPSHHLHLLRLRPLRRAPRG